MKNKLKYIMPYLPWLAVLLAFNIFISTILWLIDIRILKALLGLMFLSTILIFSLITFMLISREKKKHNAYIEFLTSPNRKAELELLSLSNNIDKEKIEQLSKILHKKQLDIERANLLLLEYEEYVEIWAHEIKLPLSLLSLVLDNQKDNLPKELAFKLEYVRNQIHNNISQILFYYRIKSEKKDFFFEEVDLKDSIVEVLDNFKPLLDEIKMDISLNNISGTYYTDYRSFEFIISQIISNSIKYSQDEAKLNISMINSSEKHSISFKDNGCGVKLCDLPHIFEKGFSGECQDMRKKSTGMGLYLVKQLADALNIDIEVKSDWLQGFEIILHLPHSP